MRDSRRSTTGVGGLTLGGGLRFGTGGYGALRAIDAATGDRRWQLKHPTASWAGVLSTAGAATQALDANRGITLAGNTGLGIYSSTMNSVLTVNGKVTGSGGTITKVGGSILHLNADNAATLSNNWNVPDGGLGTSSRTYT